jgi:hypothetical protein
MKLFDTDPESNIEFLFSKLANSFEVECQMQITKDGQIAITRKANVPLEKLRNLAQWLDSLWNECPPALICTINPDLKPKANELNFQNIEDAQVRARNRLEKEL